MPLLPRVIIGVISVQLVCFWGLLQPRQLDVKHTSQQITIDGYADIPSLFLGQCAKGAKRRQKTVSQSMLSFIQLLFVVRKPGHGQ